MEDSHGVYYTPVGRVRLHHSFAGGVARAVTVLLCNTQSQLRVRDDVGNSVRTVDSRRGARETILAGPYYNLVP